MIKCTLTNGGTLFLNMTRVHQIAKPADLAEEAMTVSYLDQDDNIARRRISDFEILSAGEVQY